MWSPRGGPHRIREGPRTIVHLPPIPDLKRQHTSSDSLGQHREPSPLVGLLVLIPGLDDTLPRQRRSDLGASNPIGAGPWWHGQVCARPKVAIWHHDRTRSSGTVAKRFVAARSGGPFRVGSIRASEWHPPTYAKPMPSCWGGSDHRRRAPASRWNRNYGRNGTWPPNAPGIELAEVVAPLRPAEVVRASRSRRLASVELDAGVALFGQCNANMAGRPSSVAIVTSSDHPSRLE